MKKAIFYLTYNGVFNNTNGIGSQTQIFLSGIDQHYHQLRNEFGEFDVHVVTEIFDEQWWGFSQAQLQYSQEVVKKYGGELHFCSFGAESKDFWTPESWNNLSQSSAEKVLEVAKRYDESLVIANDIPFLHTPLNIEKEKQNLNIKSLIALYGSSYIHLKGKLDPQRLEWEKTGLSTPQKFSSVRIGDFGVFMRNHFIKHYNVKKNDFIPYHSSLNLNSSDFQPFSDEEIQNILQKNNIPIDKKIIFAFGRADWIKGFDLLLKSVHTLPSEIITVLNVVPYSDDDPILQEYKTLIGSNKNIYLLTGYKRDLPKALSQWKNTTIVVCPSRGEPLSNIPFEVSIWAKNTGPVLLCANIEGYQEQITHGHNGFLFNPSQENDLTHQINQILKLSENDTHTIRINAYNKVITERDFYKNFRQTLEYFWK